MEILIFSNNGIYDFCTKKENRTIVRFPRDGESIPSPVISFRSAYRSGYYFSGASGVVVGDTDGDTDGVADGAADGVADGVAVGSGVSVGAGVTGACIEIESLTSPCACGIYG